MASACTVVMANEIGAGGSGGDGGIGTRFRAVRPSSCALMTIAIAAACVLVVAGVLVVREYALSAGYELASVCHIANVTYATRDAYCLYCTTTEKGKDKAVGACSTVPLPCLMVIVTYQRPGDSRQHRAIMHADSLQAAGVHNQCSFSVCLKTRDENQRAVDEFADQWRVRVVDPSADDPADPFDCFYDASDPGRVIAHKTYSRADVVHCMLWPSLVVVASAAVFLYLEARRSRLTFCGKRPADGADEEKDQLKPASSSAVHPGQVSKDAEHGTSDNDAHRHHHYHKSKPTGAEMASKISAIPRHKNPRFPTKRLGGDGGRLNGQVRSNIDVSVAGAASLGVSDGSSARRSRYSHDRSVDGKSHSVSSLTTGVDPVIGRRAGSDDGPRVGDDDDDDADGRRPLCAGDDDSLQPVSTLNSPGRCASETHLRDVV